jgi:hypothetical protein
MTTSGPQAVVFCSNGEDTAQTPSAQGPDVGVSKKENRQASKAGNVLIVSGRTPAIQNRPPIPRRIADYCRG